ncbi:MAG: ATP-binding protein, partial [Candidatus Rokuibacteriota bacterium]
MRQLSHGQPEPGGTFVGRRAALRELAAGLDEAEAGRGALVLVTGEPGMGKTRLCMEFERHARSRAARVVWGTCWEGDGAPAYWPWVQVLRDLIEPRADDAPLAADALPGDVAALLTGDRPGTESGGDLEQARFRLFDALAGVLQRAATGQPLVVVLDDLHWADTPSLLALGFLARELTGRRLFILGTYRDVEVTADHPLSGTLARLGGLTRHISLPGLDHEEIGALIALITGADPDAFVVGSVLRRTGGNPFFVAELVRLARAEGGLDALVADGADAAVPAGVRGVVDRRLRRLPEPARRVLEAAAVLGQDFDVEVTARTADVSPSAVASAIEAAEAGRLVAPSRDLTRHTFSHALVREVLYQGIGVERHATLHLRAGESLEQHHAADPAPYIAEIAAHLAAAAPAGDPAKAVAYSFDAGRRAMSLLAWEEAATQFGRALRILDVAPVAGRATSRCDLLLALGEARVWAGETDSARESFVAAAELARTAGNATRLARAALGLGTASPVWGVDSVLTELLQTAIEAVGDREPGLAAQLLARLAQAQYFSASDAGREETSRRAIEIARASGEDRPLALALVVRRVLWGPEDLPGRAAVADELLALARRTRNLDLEVQARAWRVIDLVEEGDLAAADRERLAHAALARRLRQPLHLRDAAIWRAMRALLDGRFTDAEGSAEEALRLGQQAQDPGARSMYGVQRAMIRAEQGDPALLGEAIPLVSEIADEHPEIPAWRALLAFCEARAGRLDESRLDLEQVAAGDFASVRRDATHLVALTHAADAASILWHRDVAAVLLPLLTPVTDRAVVIDRGLACKGVTARLLGLLEGVLGNHGPSIGLLERALTAHERMGARAFAARNRAELAAMLLRRDGPGDAERAASLIEEAERAARTLRMPGLLAEIEPLRRIGGPGEPVEVAANVLRREGEWWTLAFAGRAIRLRDAKGLRDIARLLATPEREVHVLELLGAPQPAARASARAAEILDPQARRAYEARIVELEEEIAEAEVRNDTERAARARGESEFLARELSAALGLGGRPRRATDEAERARKAVAWRIRDALRRIDRQ